MVLEWVVLGYAAAAEAVMVLLLTIPGLDGLRKGLVSVTRSLLKPFLSIVPFCVFLLMDIYWKYENRPTCEQAGSCSPSEYLRHQKSIMKSIKKEEEEYYEESEERAPDRGCVGVLLDFCFRSPGWLCKLIS